MSEKIVKTITLYVPGDICNMKCSYCYLTKNFKRKQNTKFPEYKYSTEHMIKAFSKKRLGGICHFIVIGSGETLIDERIVEVCIGLLKHGHVVEVVTNGVLSDRIEKLIDIPEVLLERLIVKCSLHWNELKRLNLVDIFFENIKKVIDAGASSYPFLVISEEDMDNLEEIRINCIKRLGALPPCTPCIAETTPEMMMKKGCNASTPPCTEDIVEVVNQKFDSELFRQSVRFMGIDVRKVFCYAGKYSFGVDLENGRLLKCHNLSMDSYIDFFENIDTPLDEFELNYVGNECAISSCCLQYDMFGMGLLPEVKDVPTYTEMLGNPRFFNETVRNLMDIKIVSEDDLLTDNERYSWMMDRVIFYRDKFREYQNVARNMKKEIERLNLNDKKA